LCPISIAATPDPIAVSIRESVRKSGAAHHTSSSTSKLDDSEWTDVDSDQDDETEENDSDDDVCLCGVGVCVHSIYVTCCLFIGHWNCNTYE
jgi:hypothetical protein